jgi:SAM-dependent methyltransferase
VDTIRTASGKLYPGCSTATSLNLTYRVGRIAEHLSGAWLDYGCADGSYSEALLAYGASSVVGVDVEADRIEEAKAKEIPNATFLSFGGSRVDLPDEVFDGVFTNEVMEHVDDEQESLGDIYRLMKPGGTLVVISPNRWFPFEGHGTRMFGRYIPPTPLIPWLPVRLTNRWTYARNYWPRQLAGHVQRAGFTVTKTGFIWPVLENYPWAPGFLIPTYQRWLTRIDDIPVLRRFGVSNLIIATKPTR